MHLYSGTSTEFVSAAMRNLIGERLREGFFRHFRYWLAESEVRSWKNSLAAMGRVVEVAGLRDHGIICEYQLPMSSRRLDVMITGHNDEGRPMASIVELKQWDGATDPSGLQQIGCVYTAQGFEFDYVGLIFGRDLTYTFGSGWMGNPHRSHDSVVKRAAKDSEEAFTSLVKQTYRVLLTRGLKGCYVYFEDDATRDFVLSRIDRRTDAADVELPVTDPSESVAEREASET